MSDTILLIKLKAQHAKTAFLRAATGLVGSNVVEDTAATERLYQVYCAVILGIWAVLMWLALLHFSTTAFFALGPEATIAIFLASLFLFPLLFAIRSLQNIRTCPFKFSNTDISFIATSPISSSSLTFCTILIQAIAWVIPTFLIGYLVEACLQNGLGLTVPMLSCMIPGVLCVLASLLGGWVVGILRLSRKSVRADIGAEADTTGRRGSDAGARRYPLILGMLSVSLFSLAVLLFVVLFGGLHTGAALMNAITQGFTIACVVLLLVIAVESIILKARSPYLSITKTIDENAFFADMYALRFLPLTDMTGYNEIRRRKRVASRAPKGRMGPRSGPAALVARSVLSHKRQYEGLPSILFWGVLAAPLSTVLLLGSPNLPTSDISGQSFFLWLIWVQFLIAFPTGLREMTRVFRDDMQNRMIRDSLGYSNLELFALGTLPTFLMVSAVSIAVVALVSPLADIPLGWGLVLCVLLNIVFVLCASFDGLKLSGTKRALSYEAAVIICAAIMLAVSFTNMPLLITAAALLCAAALTTIVYSSEKA